MIGLLLLALATQAPAIPKVIVELAEPEEVQIVAGGSAEARLVATIKEGFRIQANPASAEYLVPARLDLEGTTQVSVGLPEYPVGKPYRLRGADSDLSIYEGTVVIRLPLEAAGAGARGGESVEITLEGTLRYQACNDVVCLRPSSVGVSLPVKIRPADRLPAS